MRPTVRQATASDATWYIDHVRTLLAEPDVQVSLGPDEFVMTCDQQAALLDDAAKRGDLFLVAEVQGERVGELSLRRRDRAALRHSTVLGMSVAREWRKQGIGSALMQHALEWAKADATLRRVELYVYATNVPAIKMYERHGFIAEGRRRGAVRAGDRFVDDLVMVCDVT